MPDELSTIEGLEKASDAADKAFEETGASSADEGTKDQSGTIETNANENQEAKWHYDEAIPGEGEKPDWFFQDKYKNVTEQAKAYPEILKKFGDFHGAPKDGYNLEKYNKKLDKESVFLKDVLTKAETMNMSQGGLEGVLDLFVEYEETHNPDPEKFIKSLTPEQHQMAQKVIGWATNNFDEEEFAEIAEMLNSPQRLSIFAKMRGMDRETRMPKIEGSAPIPTSLDAQSMIIQNYDQYKDDPTYRARLDKQMQLALEREGKI